MVIDGDDLLLEILFRLPLKQLVRFKSVSKRWLSLISSPHFYCRHARLNYGFLVTGPGHLPPYSSKVRFFSFNGNPLVAPPFKSVVTPEGIWSILQSCNGLLLCRTYKGERTENFILNPTTMQYIKLPPRSWHWNHCNLAFDPLKSPYYKLVSVRGIDRDDYTSQVHYQIEIYSNKYGIWRKSGDPFTIPNTNMFFHDGVFSNGAIHWIGPHGHWVYFNVEEERLEIMSPLPFTVPWNKRGFRYFGESFGHLHLLDIAKYSQTTQFKVYELEKDNSNWFLKFNVDLDAIVNTRPVGYCAISILSIVREEDDDESSILLHIPGAIISYKFKDKSFKKLHGLIPCCCNDGDGGVGLPRERCNVNVYQYIESTACVRTYGPDGYCAFNILSIVREEDDDEFQKTS